jgi:hypothetical protein
MAAMVVAVEATAFAAPCPRDAVAIELVALGGPTLDDVADRLRIETNGLVGSVTYQLANGDVIGPRVVRAASCAELAKSLALVIVMSLRADEPQRSVTSEVPAPSWVAPSVETIAVLPHAAPRAKTRRIQLLLGAVGDVSRRPALVTGARWRQGHMSVGLELHVATPLTIDVEAGGSVEVTQTRIDAVPCLHVRQLAVCGLATAGMIGGKGHQLADAAHVRRAAAAVGGRVELTWRLVDLVSLRLHLDGLQTLDRTTFVVDEMAVWTSDSRELWLGAGVLANFP